MNARIFVSAAAVCLVGLGVAWGTLGPDGQQWNSTVDKAINYLKTSQAEDGSWSRDKSPGVTGVVLAGLLQTGKLSPDDPLAQRARKYIESLVNPTAGHIAGKDPQVQLQNYVTSVNVMALSLANRQDQYKKVIGDAAE